MRRIEEVAPVSIITSPSGCTILDFGQNLVGRLRLTVQGPAGHTITLRHAEVLEHGELGTRPLRHAKATDHYTLRGEGVETWEPRFTFHGFRYAEVKNWPGELNPDDIRAVVCHSDMERTGWFECSDPLVNRLHENVVWSMRGNFFDLPTDCPQRDERLGWTGDLQVFSPAASFLYDCLRLSAFLAQGPGRRAEGTRRGCPTCRPEYDRRSGAGRRSVGRCGRHCPVGALPALWRPDDPGCASSKACVPGWIGSRGRRAHHCSGTRASSSATGSTPPRRPITPVARARVPPWLPPPTLPAPRNWSAVPRACWGSGPRKFSMELSPPEIREAFASEYVTPAGRLLNDVQTAYTLAIEFGLLPEPEQRQHAAQRLSELVRSDGYHISTGFVGTPLICDALCNSGHPAVAYRLLMQRECPSWLYPVTMGATTIWERWDSMLPDGSINPGEMTSFNHYALGAVADWLHRTVGGLAPAEPGYRHLTIQPRPGGGLTHASARHRTPYGIAQCAWKIQDGKIDVDIIVPPNTTASVHLPGTDAEPVTVQSGAHHWSYAYRDPDARNPLTVDDAIGEIRDDPAAWTVVKDTILRLSPGNIFFTIGLNHQSKRSLRHALTDLPNAAEAITAVAEALAEIKK